MSLFVAQHQHVPERCPAADHQMGQTRLAHLSADNAARCGITIQAEAVVNDAHTLYMIVEAPNLERVQPFMAAYAQAARVEVLRLRFTRAVRSRVSIIPAASRDGGGRFCVAHPPTMGTLMDV